MIDSSTPQAFSNPVQPQEDEALLIGEAKANPEAFARLYDRYASKVYRYLLSRLGSVAEAQDITSLTFLKAFEMFPRYKHRQFFSAWLFAIARNKYVDYLRKAKNRSESIPMNLSDPQDDLLQAVIQSERKAALQQLIQKLPEEDRELLRLRFVAELSFAEIAALLGSKADTIKKKLYRLLERLQTQLEDEYAAHA